MMMFENICTLLLTLVTIFLCILMICGAAAIIVSTILYILCSIKEYKYMDEDEDDEDWIMTDL